MWVVEGGFDPEKLIDVQTIPENQVGANAPMGPLMGLPVDVCVHIPAHNEPEVAFHVNLSNLYFFGACTWCHVQHHIILHKSPFI